MTITGYPLVFDSPSVLLGDFIEVVRPAALRRTLTGSADIVALVNHNADMPLARRSANSLILASDATGLRVEIRAADDVTYAANAARVIGRGDAPGGSFGFATIADIWSLRDGLPFRELLDITLREISVGVTFPAYPASALQVGQRAAMSGGRTIEMARRQLRLALAR